jgi:hypothetical protein
MTIREIAENLQDAISTRCVKILAGNTKKPKYPNVNKAFFSFDKFEAYSTIRYYPTILHSYLLANYIKYFRRNREITIKVLI